MSLLLRLLPARAIRTAGRLQFRFPWLKPAINSVAHALAGDGVIQRRVGKGLRFDATGCNPGYLAGTSEPLEQELLARYAPAGGVVYDLGANAGFYAVIAARAVGPRGVVYAFEPSPKLAERVRANAGRNHLANLHVVEAAVSGVDGEVAFGITGDLSVTNSMRAAGSADALTVQSFRLDSFCADHAPPDLLLVDVEGAEIEALEGGARMIAKHLPVLMIEVHWLGQAFVDYFESALKPLGYTGSTYEGGPLRADVTRYHALLIPPTATRNEHGRDRPHQH